MLDSVRIRAFGKNRRLVELIREEAWMWLEALLGWVPGRAGRLVRGGVFSRLLSADGWLYIEEGVQIRVPSMFKCGKRVSFARDVQLNCRGGLTIGCNVMIGPGTRVLTNGHSMTSVDIPMSEQGTYEKAVSIGDDVWIGANVMVLPGVHIGRGSVLAAGAVVTKDVPEFCIAGGVPARVVRWRKEPANLNSESL